MSFRREIFDTVGGFQSSLNGYRITDYKQSLTNNQRIGSSHPAGCEDTEFCIRVGQNWPQKILLYKPEAKVHHKVPCSRVHWKYFLRRCYYEGRSKALLTLYVGSRDGLASERKYIFHVLPKGIIKGIINWLHL